MHHFCLKTRHRIRLVLRHEKNKPTLLFNVVLDQFVLGPTWDWLTKNIISILFRFREVKSR